jgi:hypothetical protein
MATAVVKGGADDPAELPISAYEKAIVEAVRTNPVTVRVFPPRGRMSERVGS